MATNSSSNSQTNNLLKIFTIIVTYNGREWVDFCLGSLRHSTIATIPIVIDNNSTDNTIQYIRSNYPETIVFEQEQNLGFGQANNIGLRYALANNADYVLLLNQDAAIAPNMLELCLAQSDGQSLLSPIHMNGNGTQVDYNFRKNSLITCDELINDFFTSQLKQSYVGEKICAACWLLPISIIKRIGGFNPLFFHYAEDDNYYHRLVYHKINTLIVPQAKMYHDRVEFGNKTTYNKQWLPNILLLTACNINLMWSQQFANYLKIFLQCYIFKLPLRQYRIGSYFCSICKILLKSKKIISYREYEKQLAPTFL